MPFFRTAKKYAKKAVKATGKRYGVSYGRKGLRMQKSSLARIDKDVQMIKSRLNVEKKFVTSSVTTASVGQSTVNSPGWYGVDLLPAFPQGDGESQRVGNSLKLTGFHQKFQLQGQQFCYTDRKLKFHYIRTTDTTSTIAQIIGDVYDPNPLTGFIDYHSDFNYSNMRRAHKVIRKRNFTLKADSSLLAAQADTYRTIGTTQIGLKMQELLRFEGDAANSPKDYRIILVIFSDVGNNHPSGNASNAGCLVTFNNTGVEIQHHYKFHYVDN